MRIFKKKGDVRCGRSSIRERWHPKWKDFQMYLRKCKKFASCSNLTLWLTVDCQCSNNSCRTVWQGLWRRTGNVISEIMLTLISHNIVMLEINGENANWIHSKMSMSMEWWSAMLFFNDADTFVSISWKGKKDNEMTTMSYGITESEMFFFRTGLMMEDLPTALTHGMWMTREQEMTPSDHKIQRRNDIKVTSTRHFQACTFFPNTMKRWWRLWSKTEVLTYVILHERNVLIRLTVCDNIFRSVDFVPIYRKQASNRIHFHERYFHTWQWNDF